MVNFKLVLVSVSMQPNFFYVIHEWRSKILFLFEDICERMIDWSNVVKLVMEKKLSNAIG